MAAQNTKRPVREIKINRILMGDAQKVEAGQASPEDREAKMRFCLQATSHCVRFL